MSIKSKLERNMAELLNLPEDDEEVKKEEVKKVDPNKDILDSDFDHSRENLESLLTTGQEALQYALSVAKQSDDPKAYQVVSNMITQLANINEQLLELHLKKQKHNHNEFWKKDAARKSNIQEQNPIPTIKDSSQPAQITNNTIFVGGAAELSKIIKQQLGYNEHDVTD